MEDLNKESKKPNKKRLFIKVALVLLAVVFFSKLYSDYKKTNEIAVVPVASNFNPKVLGQTDTTSSGTVKKPEAVASSENFNATQISVNGGVGLSDALVDFENSGLLTVNNVKSELYSTKEGDKSEVKAIISCQTNKKTIIQVEYLKSGEKEAKVFKDEYFGLSHVVVIPALDSDSVYRYTVSAQDPTGNKAISEQFVFYTGAPNISLMEVLSNATQKVFGWAMKR